MGKYDDIINLPHHVSKKHPQMSLSARAAQFAPFAALTGHENAIKETARLTEKRVELDEQEKAILDYKMKEIKRNILLNPLVKITYFIPDEKKDGGEYVIIEGHIKKIDNNKHLIILEENIEIPMSEIIHIN